MATQFYRTGDVIFEYEMYDGVPFIIAARVAGTTESILESISSEEQERVESSLLTLHQEDPDA